MKVSKVIQMLKEMPDQDEEIVLAFWTKELFQGYYEDGSLTDEVWRDVVADIDAQDLSEYTNESAFNDITNRIDFLIGESRSASA
jgi:Mg/Co/Ni transporter MgtE